MKFFAGNYDVAVIGAGHAGIEAALAAARLGASTVVFTVNLDWIGNMACNPSIGGTSKGHLVREIDALGGEMGKAADKTLIQSRILNLGKGPAVHSLRAQIDRREYTQYMKHCLENQDKLDIKQAEIVSLKKNDDGIFTGEKPLPMFDNSYSKVCASIETNGVTSSMWIMENDYYFLSDVSLPQLENLQGLNYNFGKNSFSLSGTYYNGGISNYSGRIITDKRMDELNDIKVTFSVNGEFVKEIEITELFTDINEKIPAKIF